MRIHRGINRVAIVLAIIAAVFGFYQESMKYYKSNSSSVKAFTDDFILYIKDTFLVDIKDEIPTNPPYSSMTHAHINSVLEGYPNLLNKISSLSMINVDPVKKSN